jgi:hypothetical protein
MLGLELTFPPYPTATPGRYSWYSDEHSERALSEARERHACLAGKMMNWVMLRSIPVKEFWLVQRKVSGPDRRFYLRNHGWSVQKIRFERVEGPWRMFCKEKCDPMVKVALNDVCSYCPKVTALHFSRRMSSEETARIMHTWPALRRDTPLLRAMGEHPEWVAIRIADGASVTCDWNAYCRNVSTHLRHIQLDVQIDAHALLALIRRCPQLVYLSVNCCEIREAILEELVQRCPRLITLALGPWEIIHGESHYALRRSIHFRPQSPLLQNKRIHFERK